MNVLEYGECFGVNLSRLHIVFLLLRVTRVPSCRSAGNARIDSARLQRTGREKRTLRVWTQRVCSVKYGGPFLYPVWVACWSRLLVGLPLVRRIRHRPR